jgi:hypothetical protein
MVSNEMQLPYRMCTIDFSIVALQLNSSRCVSLLFSSALFFYLVFLFSFLFSPGLQTTVISRPLSLKKYVPPIAPSARIGSTPYFSPTSALETNDGKSYNWVEVFSRVTNDSEDPSNIDKDTAR